MCGLAGAPPTQPHGQATRGGSRWKPFSSTAPPYAPNGSKTVCRNAVSCRLSSAAGCTAWNTGASVQMSSRRQASIEQHMKASVRPWMCYASASSASPMDDNTPEGAKHQHKQERQQEPPAGILGKLKSIILGNKSSLDRARLAELGFGAFAAYGVISNLNAGVLLTLAWLTVVKTQGVTPLAPGMWTKFLTVYAGLWVSSHFLRPLRLSLAIAAAPAFDAALGRIMKWTGVNKAVAFGIMLAGIAMGTLTTLVTTIWLCGGFPPSPA